jgi:hypothetical protein
MYSTTLRVLLNGHLIFQSDRRWLMPLFDFEDYLCDHPHPAAAFEFHDKVIGKAAALLMIRLGTSGVYADVMSVLARDILARHAIPFTCVTLVERISCQTEQILLEIDDPDKAYQLLCQRINRPIN